MNANGRKETLVTEEVAMAMWKVLTQLLRIFRWSEYTNDDRFNELNKQALNSSIAYFLAYEAQHEGYKIDITRLPKIIFYRAFEKLILCDIREDYANRILKLGNIPRERFDAIIEKQIENIMGANFAEFIKPDKSWPEFKIFQGGTKLATKMEYTYLKRLMPKAKGKEIKNDLKAYNDLVGFRRMSSKDSKEMTFFRQISALRNRIRWQKYLGTVKCSVLGHNFEVAVYAYLLALKEYNDEQIATKCFFMGIFHDMPETFTGDMPSPVKYAISGLREAVELFELEMVEANVNLRPHLREALRIVMMEEKEQKGLKALVKQADIFSSDVECARQIIAGSKEVYFAEVLRKDLGEKRVTAEPFNVVLARLVKEIL